MRFKAPNTMDLVLQLRIRIPPTSRYFPSSVHVPCRSRCRWIYNGGIAVCCVCSLFTWFTLCGIFIIIKMNELLEKWGMAHTKYTTVQTFRNRYLNFYILIFSNRKNMCAGKG